ncbi:MAG: hypothetical protein DRI73_01280, partial [Bacteroidetes bacterium]
MSIFKPIKKLFIRELKLISGDGSIILTIFIAPLLYMLLLGSIYKKKDIVEVPLTVIDMDQTSLSRMFIRFIDATQKVKVNKRAINMEEGLREVEKMNAFGFIFIPKGFEKRINLMEGANVSLLLNNTRFLMSNEINKTVNRVALEMGAGIRIKYFAEQGVQPQLAREMVMPLEPNVHFVYNIFNNYGFFLIPGLLLLIMQQTLFIGLGESVSLEREEGKLSGWLSSDHGILTAILGKNLFYLFLYLAYFLLMFVAVFPYFHIQNIGGFLPVFSLVLLFITAIILFTNLIASFFKKEIFYMEVIAFTTYPIFLITGYSWPDYALPVFHKYVAMLLPTTPFFRSVIKVTQEGSSFQYISKDLILLLAQILFFGLLLVWRLWWLRG